MGEIPGHSAKIMLKIQGKWALEAQNCRDSVDVATFYVDASTKSSIGASILKIICTDSSMNTTTVSYRF
jgi:hypothetical protein